jgi:hypothetical protein
VAAVTPDQVAEWSEGIMFRVDAKAGLDAVAARCAVSFSGETSAEAAVSALQSPDTEPGDEAERSPVSLEQAASAKIDLGKNSASLRDGLAAGPLEAGTLGLEGDSNTFYGYKAGISISGPAKAATFIGAFAGTQNTAGENNTFIGKEAGASNTIASNNTFLGALSGYSNIKGKWNTFLGSNAGVSNTHGMGNTFIGFNAGCGNLEGYGNTFIGSQTGYYNASGNGNVFIGLLAGCNEAGSNRLYIDNTDTATPLIYGEFDNNIVRVHGQLQMVSAAGASDIRLKRDIRPLEDSLERVAALQGVSYRWDTGQYPGWGFTKDRQIGLVAQAVEAVIPELVSTDSRGYKAVSYDKLTAVLVEAVKALKAENETLRRQIEELRASLPSRRG